MALWTPTHGTRKPPFGALLNPTHPFARGHLATLVFNENSGIPTVRFGAVGRETMVPTVTGSPTWRGDRFGPALRLVTTDNINIGPENLIPSNAVTILIVRRKTDTTNRDSATITCGTTTNKVTANMPWSDGIVYWDFGGNSGNKRISASGLSFSTTESGRWVFSAGPSGLKFWQNGVQRASNSVAASRTVGSSNILINSAGDNQELSFISILNYQWSDELCRWWSAEPYAHLYTERRTSYFLVSVEGGSVLPAFDALMVMP